MSGHFDIIGLVGQAGSGKDTCAGVLAALAGFVPVAFADGVRRELADAFGVDYAMFTGRAGKERPVPELAITRCADRRFIQCMTELGLDCTEPRSPRQAMRMWGTEYRRAADGDDYWIEQLNHSVHQLIQSGRRRICISDVRFPNEAAYVRRLGGALWRLRRNATYGIWDSGGHSSEVVLLTISCDAVLVNDARLEDFHGLVADTYRLHDQVTRGGLHGIGQ